MADIDVPQKVTSVSPKVSGPTTQRKSPTDFTGLNAERLNAEKADERRAAASQMAMVTSVPADYEPSGEVQVMEVESNERMVTFEVHTKVEDMTWGRKVVDPGDLKTGRPAVMGSMNILNFEPGRRYRYPEDLVDHLQEKGYISYRA